MLNYPVVHRSFESAPTPANNVFAVWATADKLAVRVLNHISEEDAATIDRASIVAPSFFETIAPVFDENAFCYVEVENEVYLLISERVIDINDPFYGERFKSCNPVLIAYNGTNNIPLPIVMDQSHTTSLNVTPYATMNSVSSIFGVRPLVMVHPNGVNTRFDRCAITLFHNHAADMIACNLAITKTVDRGSPNEDNTHRVYDTSYVYGVPEIEQAEVSKGETFPVVITAWSFPAEADFNPEDFSQAVVNTDVDTVWEVIVYAYGKPQDVYHVHLENGVGVVNVETGKYAVGDELHIVHNYRTPLMLQEVKVRVVA